MAKDKPEPCGTCGLTQGHASGCAANRGPEGQQKNKQNFAKRPDDGRRKK